MLVGAVLSKVPAAPLDVAAVPAGTSSSTSATPAEPCPAAAAAVSSPHGCLLRRLGRGTVVLLLLPVSSSAAYGSRGHLGTVTSARMLLLLLLRWLLLLLRLLLVLLVLGWLLLVMRWLLLLLCWLLLLLLVCRRSGPSGARRSVLLLLPSLMRHLLRRCLVSSSSSSPLHL